MGGTAASPSGGVLQEAPLEKEAQSRLVMKLKKSMSQKLRMYGRDCTRPGWYFVTLGADYHKPLFGTVENGAMRPNDVGPIVEHCWRDIPWHYSHIVLGAWQWRSICFDRRVKIIK